MSILVVPTFSDPSYQESSTLEGTAFCFQFDWSERGACWYMSIADANGVDIYNGVKLVSGFLLLKKCKDQRRPGWHPTTGIGGDFMILSATDDQSPPGQYDLDAITGRCQLLYITSDWVAQIATGQAAALLAQVDVGATPASPSSTYGQR